MESRTIIVYASPHTYCSHPCVAKLANGDWVVVFCESIQRQPILHPPSDPRFMNLLCRSRDQGRTWGQPRVIPGYDWYGVEVAGIAQISNGDMLANQWRFHWLPLEEARKRWRPPSPQFFVKDPETRVWRAARSSEDWDRHPYPYARADGGAYVHISADNGHTWGPRVSVEIEPYRAAFSPKGVIELSNGDLLLALGSHDHDPLHANFVVRSRDGGRTWQRPVEVARDPRLIFSEPSVAEAGGGKLLLMSREETTGYIYQSESTDGGFTWSPPRQLAFWGSPTHCIRTADGRIVIVYGRRKPPFGIRAAVSENDGVTWGPEIVIRDDSPNDNLGYPSVIEYAPAKLFTAYYAETRSGTTCIQGSYFAL